MRKSKVARQILRYLVNHPGAQDTWEGIVHWWIPEQQIRVQITSVKKAIGELVTEKLILERRGKDSRIHYQLNQGKKKEIEEFLKPPVLHDSTIP